MKSYKNLYDVFYTKDNFELAIKNSSKGKKKKRYDVRNALSNIDAFEKKVFDMIPDYHPPHHTPKTIYDGISRKKREIIVPTYMEQVIQHMVVNVLKPMFLRGVYEHAYGSIPKRGAHDGKKAIERWIRTDKRNCKYVLKLDIKKYFESIKHDVLKDMISKQLKDKRVKDLLFKIIESTDKGLPLGFYTSQWLAMWHLKELDHYIKEQCYAPHYVRYMDDMVILGSNKRKLWETYYNIKLYLKSMGLELNNRSQLFRFNYYYGDKERGRDIDFMGFRFFRNRTIMRRSTYYKMLRKVNRVYKKDKPTIFELRQVMSYLGYIKSTDVYDVYLKYIKPYFSIKDAKRRISNYDRRKNKTCGKLLRTAIT